MKGEFPMEKYQFLTCKCGCSMARIRLGNKTNHEEYCRECEAPMTLVTDERKIKELHEFFFGEKTFYMGK